MILTCINRSQTPMPKAYLERWLKQVWRQLLKKKVVNKSTPSELVLVMVDNKEGRQLNNQYRQKDYATDVLSFTGLDHDSLGELVLCAPVLKRQAKEHQLSFRDEAAYMVLHGLLHLLGFDHEQGGAQAQKMYRLQDEIFAGLRA